MKRELSAKRDALVANYGEQRDALLADLLPEVRALLRAHKTMRCRVWP